MTVKAKGRIFEIFRSATDAVLDPKLESQRKAVALAFLKTLSWKGIHLSEFEEFACCLPVARGPHAGSEPMPSARGLYSQLDPEERSELRQYVNDKMKKLGQDFPELVKG